MAIPARFYFFIFGFNPRDFCYRHEIIALCLLVKNISNIIITNNNIVVVVVVVVHSCSCSAQSTNIPKDLAA